MWAKTLATQVRALAITVYICELFVDVVVYNAATVCIFIQSTCLCLLKSNTEVNLFFQLIL